MIAWRFARGADIDRFYGERPKQTARALTVLIDDEPVAIAGLIGQGDHCIAFSDVKPALEPHLKSMPVLRVIMAVQRMCADSKLPVFALKTTNSGLLPRMGFVPTDDPEVYRWVDGQS